MFLMSTKNFIFVTRIYLQGLAVLCYPVVLKKKEKKVESIPTTSWLKNFDFPLLLSTCNTN